VARLLEPGKGRGLMIIGGNRIPYANILDDFEDAAILNRGPMAREINKTFFGIDDGGKYEEEQEEIQEPVYVLDSNGKYILATCGITCKDWLGDKTKYPNGFEKNNAINPMTGKQTVAFFKKDLVAEDGEIKGQLKDHYFTVCILGGELLRMGFDVSFDDYGTGQQADLKITYTYPDGSKYCVAAEYETPESNNSIKDLQDKRDRLLNQESEGVATFQDIIFIGKKEIVEKLKQAVGNDFVRMRGTEVREYFENIRTGKQPVLMPRQTEQSDIGA
jgi:hypothetical protein